MVNFEHVIADWVVDMIHFSDLLYFDEDNPLKNYVILQTHCQ